MNSSYVITGKGEKAAQREGIGKGQRLRRGDMEGDVDSRLLPGAFYTDGVSRKQDDGGTR